MNALVTKSDIAGLKLLRRGKVRDVYDLGGELLMVSTDRLSAFDHILPTPIPEKGVILTQVSAFWFKLTEKICPNHLVSVDLQTIQRHLPSGVRLDPSVYEGRVALCKKAQRIDAECVARGYLAGSGLKEYRANGKVCGHPLPPGLQEASKLPNPIFTPATKNDNGHDENITREQLKGLIGEQMTDTLETMTLRLYGFATDYLEKRGLILADTKFEFGLVGDRLTIIDEMLTPDSSRVWPASSYVPGKSPESFDKQFVRDYLEKIGWDKNPPVPELPDEVAEGTARRYREFQRLVTR